MTGIKTQYRFLLVIIILIFGKLKGNKIMLLYRCDFVISPIGIYQNPAAHKPGLNFRLATLPARMTRSDGDQNEIQFGIIYKLVIRKRP